MRRQFVRGAIVALALAGSAWSGSVLAQGSQTDGRATYPLQPGCVLHATVAGEHPRDAIDAMLVVGARVTTEYRRGGVVWVDAEQAALHEDDERWGDLREYDVRCPGDERD